jgi:hypothetical protein
LSYRGFPLFLHARLAARTPRKQLALRANCRHIYPFMSVTL